MAVVIVKPNGNNGASGWTATGGSLHGVVADDSDATYLTSIFTPNRLTLNLAAPSIPGGAMVKAALLALRSAYVGAPGVTSGKVRCDGDSTDFVQQITWPSPTVAFPAALTSDEGALDIDNIAIELAFAASARLHEFALHVVYVPKPVIDAVGPTGTLTTDNRPTITWTNVLDAHGGEQTRYQVKIYDATTHGGFGSVNPNTTPPFAQSEILAGNATSWRAGTPLPDDGYRAYVRCGQTVNGIIHWSDWDNVNFTVDVNRPGVPSISLLGEDDWARISIELEENSGAADTDWWEVQSSPNGTSGWQDLLTTEGGGKVLNPAPGASGTEVVGDYESANEEVRYYRARAVTDHGNEVTVSSDWCSPVSSSWDSRFWWLKHRTLSGLNLAVTVDEQPGWEAPSRDGEFQGLGASSSVIVSDTPAPKRGQISFGVDSDLDRERLFLLYETRDPVLVQAIPGSLWTDRWVRLMNHRERPFVDRHGVTLTIDQFDWIEVLRPE